VKKQRIPANLRRRIRAQAQYRCGYCLRAEELAGERMTLEHLRPESKGGKTEEQNLWLACRRCNEYKGVQTHALDPLTGKRARLFNPRAQAWSEHFAWDESGTEIQGLTPTGRFGICLAARAVRQDTGRADFRLGRHPWTARR